MPAGSLPGEQIPHIPTSPTTIWRCCAEAQPSPLLAAPAVSAAVAAAQLLDPDNHLPLYKALLSPYVGEALPAVVLYELLVRKGHGGRQKKPDPTKHLNLLGLTENLNLKGEPGTDGEQGGGMQCKAQLDQLVKKAKRTMGNRRSAANSKFRDKLEKEVSSRVAQCSATVRHERWLCAAGAHTPSHAVLQVYSVGSTSHSNWCSCELLACCGSCSSHVVE